MTRLSVVDLSVALGGNEVLRDVSLEARGGELVLVLGPNGAGKTTLLRTIAGLIKPSKGKVVLDDREVSSMRPSERAKVIAYMPASLPLPGLGQSVAEFVAASRYPFQRGLSLGPSLRDLELARRLLEKLGIGHLWSRPLYATSSGERQRAQLAHVLARGARLVLVDEPTSFQDLRGRVLVYNALREEARRGAIVVIATHDMVFASLFADKVVLMSNGEVIDTGRPEKVMRQSILSRIFRVKIAEAKIGEKSLPIPIEPL